MITPILIFTLTSLLLGILLGFAAIRYRVEGDPIVDKIDSILPQTQCGQCGFPGCKPYARAIAKGEAEINQCPPGGEQGVIKLAEVMGCDPIPINIDLATETSNEPMLAVIDEVTCIGCTKCIQVCPVDAIVGAAKQKHTVIAEYCTGCKLCLPPICPVDKCIIMVAENPSTLNWKWPEPSLYSDSMRGAGS